MDDGLKARIRRVLREAYFHDETDRIETLDDVAGMTRVVVISPKLQGRGLDVKHDLIMAALIERLPTEDWQRVSLAVGASPEDAEGLELHEIRSL